MFEYRHNKCVGHTPLRSYSPFLSTAKIMEMKKDVGVSFSALIPTIRLSHCPYLRISNVKPAHVERYI